jgi:hypothetical protein
MRGDCARHLFDSWFVTVAAIQFCAIRQSVLIQVIYVLLAIEVGVVITPRREITLRWERDEFPAMTDCAGLTRCKLSDVALDASVVTWKFHLQTIIMFGRGDAPVRRRAGSLPLVAGVALQFLRLLSIRNPDDPRMSLMREAAVIGLLLVAAARGQRRNRSRRKERQGH